MDFKQDVVAGSATAMDVSRGAVLRRDGKATLLAVVTDEVEDLPLALGPGVGQDGRQQGGREAGNLELKGRFQRHKATDSGRGDALGEGKEAVGGAKEEAVAGQDVIITSGKGFGRRCLQGNGVTGDAEWVETGEIHKVTGVSFMQVE